MLRARRAYPLLRMFSIVSLIRVATSLARWFLSKTSFNWVNSSPCALDQLGETGGAWRYLLSSKKTFVFLGAAVGFCIAGSVASDLRGGGHPELSKMSWCPF